MMNILISLKMYIFRHMWGILLFCTLMATFFVIFFLTFFASGPMGTSSNKNEMEVYIEKGTSSIGIAKKLCDKGVLLHPYGFILRAKFLGKLNKLQAGEYLVKYKMNMGELIEKIASGDVIHRSFTVPEGVTVAEVVKKLKENDLLDGEIKTIPQEGTLLPATYPYHRGEDRQDILLRMQKAMHVALKNLWENRSKDCTFKSPQEALIMASIIEKETSRKLEEQPRIAGVFFQRIKRNMRLQSDPTVIYALTLGKKAMERKLSIADLSANSPFNTYKHHGLPPTPIACPGENAIKAALSPINTEELFFVADGTGGHNFAKTLAEHNKNVQKWRKICAER